MSNRVFLIPLIASLSSPAHTEERLQFNRDIRPILTENCYYCHGPDQNHRKADLRLDVREAAVEEGAIVPGKPEASEVISRLFTADADELMPPPDSHKKLSPEEKAILKRWVAEGAEYQGHWAFEKPTRPPVPEVKNAGGQVRNPIDAFVLRRLEQEGLGLSPAADPQALIRRVTLDLTGLPPEAEVVAAFAADPSDAAYEALVDRLLQSPAYGEQMAAQWLDFARYADSHGFQTDSSRSMWPWRDWVIGAFNRNLPFDQFTIEQLAGDLLPNARLDQVVATGFHRNHRINGEGGIIDEEWRIENIIDRVETTGATWMGLTLGCARCHDHKYDPITQREFFEMFAFFNNIEETGVIRGASNRTGGNPDPSIKVPNVEQQKQLTALKAEITRAEAEVKEQQKHLPDLVAAWEPVFKAELAAKKPVWEPLMPDRVTAVNGTTFTRQEDGSYLAGGPVPGRDTYVVEAPIPAGLFSGILLETFPDATLPNASVGRNDNGNFVLTRVEAEITAPTLEKPLRVTFTDAEAEFSQKGWGIESLIAEAHAKVSKRKKAAAGNRGKGWAVDGPTRREPNRAMLLPAEAVSVPKGARLVVRLVHETLAKHQIGRFRLSYAATAPERVTLAGDGAAPAEIRAVLDLPREKRSAAQQASLTAYFRAGFDSPVKRADAALASARKRHEDFETALPSTMVMKELPETRPAHVLIRGEYASPGEQVSAATPAVLPPLPGDAPRNRLTLARWLVSPEHPLTARVWVNRQWERLFGRGLVKSSENLGVQSDPPSHPELLDWLTSDFLANGWHLKPLHKKILLSATYRQTARRGPDAAALVLDPENKLLWRFQPRRLDAEEVRDAALAASGELDAKAGGEGEDAKKPRRSIYTKKIRNTQDEVLRNLDAPAGFASTPKRDATTTATQSLLFFNGDWPLERARLMAARLTSEHYGDPAAQVRTAYELVFNRTATAAEQKDALSFLKQQTAQLRRETPPPPPVTSPLAELSKHFPASVTQIVKTSKALHLQPGSVHEKLRVRTDAIEGERFFVEALIHLDALYPDASVRTIVSRWNNGKTDAGWAFGVTSQKSAYQPNNLIMQLSGDDFQGTHAYEVVASGLRIPTGKAHYVAASVSNRPLEGRPYGGSITFYVLDLTDPAAVMQTVTVPHEVVGGYIDAKRALVVGGRDSQKGSLWDGGIAQVIVSNGERKPEWKPMQNAGAGSGEGGCIVNLIGQEVPAKSTDTFVWESSAPAAKPATRQDPAREALADFCHALLNANEFFYLH